MDMNKAFYQRKEDRDPKWHVVDAEGKVLGRLATHIADVLRGKNRPEFAPHTDAGDYVVVINAEKVKLTGKKWEDKIYDRYTGYIGGYRTRTAKEVRARNPEDIILLAVKRMLPKNNLNREIYKKLKVYAGTKHPHTAQVA